jgi:hypothetical protein
MLLGAKIWNREIINGAMSPSNINTTCKPVFSALKLIYAPINQGTYVAIKVKTK